jgi:hypothetical protein
MIFRCRKISRMGFDVPAWVRVIKLQDEIAPPTETADFVQKIIDWAESCRVNRSAEILSFNPDVSFRI